jgi:hypothetical protein
VDNNLFLSPRSLSDWSQGGAYVHNLFGGRIVPRPELRRQTPFQRPHGTQVAGLRNTEGGDDRFYNDIFVAQSGLAAYDKAAHRMFMGGNVFLKGAKAIKHEQDPLVNMEFDPSIDLVEVLQSFKTLFLVRPEVELKRRRVGRVLRQNLLLDRIQRYMDE